MIVNIHQDHVLTNAVRELLGASAQQIIIEKRRHVATDPFDVDCDMIIAREPGVPGTVAFRVEDDARDGAAIDLHREAALVAARRYLTDH